MTFIHKDFESGSRTVLGRRPSSCPPLLDAMVSAVEHVVTSGLESGLEGGEIEVEGRLGTAVNLAVPTPADYDGAVRLELPVETEVLLKQAARDGHDLFRPGFSAGIRESQFKGIVTRMEAIISGKAVGTSQRRLFKVDPNIKKMSTVDETYHRSHITASVLGNAPRELADAILSGGIRVSYPRQLYPWDEPGEKPQWVEVLSKQRLRDVIIFTGKQAEAVDPVDFRFSVNRETNLMPFLSNGTISLPTQQPTLRRAKDRITFRLAASKVELTKVVTRTSKGEEETSFEVEVEMDWALLRKEICKKLRGEPHTAFEMLNDFLYVVRDLASVASHAEEAPLASLKASSISSSLTTLLNGKGPVDLTSMYPSSSYLHSFSEYTKKINKIGKNSNCTRIYPLIGHYAFELQRKGELDEGEEWKARDLINKKVDSG